MLSVPIPALNLHWEFMFCKNEKKGLGQHYTNCKDMEQITMTKDPPLGVCLAPLSSQCTTKQSGQVWVTAS